MAHNLSSPLSGNSKKYSAAPVMWLYMLVLMIGLLTTSVHADSCGNHGHSMDKDNFYDAIEDGLSQYLLERLVNPPAGRYEQGSRTLTLYTKQSHRQIRVQLTYLGGKLNPIAPDLGIALSAARQIRDCKSGSKTKGGWKDMWAYRYDFDVFKK